MLTSLQLGQTWERHSYLLSSILCKERSLQHHTTRVRRELRGLGSCHFEQSRCQGLLREVVTSRVKFRLGHGNFLDNTVLDKHCPPLAAANNSNTGGTIGGHFHANGLGEFTRWIGKHGDHASFSALVLFPSFHHRSIVYTVDNDFVNACLLKCVLRFQVPRYLSRRSGWGEGSWEAHNENFSPGSVLGHVNKGGREARVQADIRDLRVRCDGSES
mmetsp:Transcript_130452/g.194196  ORF Transcript_130452/g.194196 Transcript_130452/m.194196 type:complete len:216 (-) Transcript_130452:75-722(-)